MKKLWITLLFVFGIVISLTRTSSLRVEAKQEVNKESVSLSTTSNIEKKISNRTSGLESVDKVKKSKLKTNESSIRDSKLTPIDDGIDNWEPVAQTEVGSLSVGVNQSLKYTFANSDGSVFQRIGGKIVDYMAPKYNIYIDDNGKVIGAFMNHQGGQRSSYDYALIINKKVLALPTLKDTSLSFNMPDYKFYRGYDQTGQKVLKAVGMTTISNWEVPEQHYQVEFVLRPMIGRAVIQQEMYITNSDSQPHDAAVFFAKYLKLDDNQYVHHYAQGNNAGLYMQEEKYKLFMNMKVPHGPTYYSLPVYSFNQGEDGDARSTYGYNGYSGLSINSVGLESKHLAEGTKLTPNGGDGVGLGAYSNKWQWENFQPGVVKHYRTDIGMTPASVVVPDATLDYQNNTSKNGKNYVGNQLTLTLAAHNLGFKSTWKDVTITHTVPVDLDIDTSDVQIELNDGTKVKPAETSYDEKTRLLTIKLPNDLTDGQWGKLIYNATINRSASGSIIKPSFVAQGDNHEATATEDIPVELSPVTLDKTVRTTTNPNAVYKNAIETYAKAILDYKIELRLDNKSATLTSGTLKDTLPKGLTLVSNSAKIQYSSDDAPEPIPNIGAIQLKSMLPGQTTTLTYQAQVNEGLPEDTVIKNKVEFSGKTANGDLDALTSEASAKIVAPKVGKVMFKYIDRQTGEPIGAKQVTASGTIGKHVSELTPADISDGQDPNKIRPAYIDGYTPVDLTDADDLTTATFSAAKDIDPEIQAGEITYTIRYEKQRLAITALPIKMDFGMLSDTQNERTFYLPAPTAIPRSGYQKNPYHIEISDYWGIRNWSLDVKQQHQFEGQYVLRDKQGQITSETAQKVILNGARLQFNNAKLTTIHADGQTGEESKIDALDHFNLDPNGTPRRLIVQNKRGHFLENSSDNQSNLTYDHPGYSVYRYQFGDEQSADYSIGLHVPATTKRYATHYNTKLQWNLTVAP